MDSPSIVHGPSTVCPGTLRGHSMGSMDCPWIVRVSSMDCPWTVHELSMGNAWTIHGQSMERP
eukprot:3998771-Lingulodinium_polyedra.AAC.1